VRKLGSVCRATAASAPPPASGARTARTATTQSCHRLPNEGKVRFYRNQWRTYNPPQKLFMTIFKKTLFFLVCP
jgi:hypothetical protein